MNQEILMTDYHVRGTDKLKEHCDKFPNNKDIHWHMKLTNGFDSPDNVDGNLIKNQLKEETSQCYL